MAPRPRQQPTPSDDSTDEAAVRTHLARIRNELAALEGRLSLPYDVRDQVETLVEEIEAHLQADQPLQHPLPTLGQPSGSNLSAALDRLDTLVNQVMPPTTSELAPLELMEFPASPTVHATLKSIYAGGDRPRWEETDDGRPEFVHETSKGQIRLHFEHPLDSMGAVAAVWQMVSSLTTETADIFLVLISRLAELPDPRLQTARMRLDEIADARGVRLRGGRVSRLHEDFMHQIQILSRMRLTMVWDDPRGRGKLTFGQTMPDRLLDIVDIELERTGEIWRAFSFRAGQALAYFMHPDEIRWIGSYAKALLRLNAQRQSRAKRMGTYFSLLAAIAGKHQRHPRATPRSILAFIGEEPNYEVPSRTVDGVIEACQQLIDIGFLSSMPDLEPPNRHRGFFSAWLERAVTIPLSPQLATLPTPAQRTLPATLSVPASGEDLQRNPGLVRQFRTRYELNLEDLASHLNISHSTLSRYERGRRAMPAAIAEQILALWRDKAAR